jgi:hypothetical protein
MGHRNAVWLAFRYFLQNLQEVGNGLAAVIQLAIPQNLPFGIQNTRSMGRSTPIEPDVDRELLLVRKFTFHGTPSFSNRTRPP